jgi:Zn-finger nucleic acid-binding protein
MADTSPKKSLQCPNCGASVTEDAVRCEYCRSVLTITACPSCFGAVFMGMKHCPNCGTAIERNEVGSDSNFQCPRCERPLITIDIGATRVQECDCCGGIWLDTASFQKICEDREKQERVMLYNVTTEPTKQPSENRKRKFYMPCPECGELMNLKNFAGCSGVVIDICTAHGIWFERQELQCIVNFIRDGGLRKARENELANLKAEQSSLKAMKYGDNLERISFLQGSSPQDLSDGRSLIDVLYDIAKNFLR